MNPEYLIRADPEARTRENRAAIYLAIGYMSGSEQGQWLRMTIIRV